MKNGFTLVELLAVIVILAIIALITTPIVLSIIDDTKESAMLRSAEMYLSGVENAVMRENMNSGGNFRPNECTISNGNMTCGSTNVEVEVDGEKPKNGRITFEEGKIKEVKLKYETGVVVKDNSNNLVLKTKNSLDNLCTHDITNGVPENQVGAKYSCNFGGGEKNFYILELGTNPVSNSTLESDEVALILEGNYDTTKQYWCDQNGENPSNNVCAANGLTSKLDEMAGAWTKLERDQIGLPSAEQIMVADGRSENAYTDSPILTNSWLYNWPDNEDFALGENAPYGYWTSSPVVDDSRCAWFVGFNGHFSYDNLIFGFSFGVRPVITIKI